MKCLSVSFQVASQIIGDTLFVTSMMAVMVFFPFLFIRPQGLQKAVMGGAVEPPPQQPIRALATVRTMVSAAI